MLAAMYYLSSWARGFLSFSRTTQQQQKRHPPFSLFSFLSNSRLFRNRTVVYCDCAWGCVCFVPDTQGTRWCGVVCTPAASRTATTVPIHDPRLVCQAKQTNPHTKQPTYRVNHIDRRTAALAHSLHSFSLSGVARRRRCSLRGGERSLDLYSVFPNDLYPLIKTLHLSITLG